MDTSSSCMWIQTALTGDQCKRPNIVYTNIYGLVFQRYGLRTHAPLPASLQLGIFYSDMPSYAYYKARRMRPLAEWSRPAGRSCLPRR